MSQDFKFLLSSASLAGLLLVGTGTTRIVSDDADFLVVQQTEWWLKNRSDASHPSIGQLEILYSKAKCVCKIVPQEAKDDDDDSNAMKSEGYCPGGTGFLVAERYLVTCFHVLFNVKTEPREFNAKKWSCTFHLLGEGAKVEFEIADIRYSPLLDNDPNNFANLGFDFVLVELADNDAWKTLAPKLEPRNFIRLFSDPHISLLDAFDQKPENQQTIFLIGYPTQKVGPDATHPFNHLIVTTRDNAIISCDNWDILYQNTTHDGMSGSPGLLADGALAAMHRRAGPTMKSLHPRTSTQGQQRETFCNFGLRVALFLKDEFGAVPFDVPTFQTGKDEFGFDLVSADVLTTNQHTMHTHLKHIYTQYKTWQKAQAEDPRPQPLRTYAVDNLNHSLKAESDLQRNLLRQLSNSLQQSLTDIRKLNIGSNA